MLGQYGANEETEPEVLLADADAAEVIRTVFGDKNATVCVID